MLSDSEIKELVSKSRAVKAEISEMKSELDKVNSVKEEWYQKKDEFSKEIVKLIREIKSFRSLRDKLTASVRESKEKRTKMNSLINEKIAAIKKLQEERGIKPGKNGRDESPAALKRELEGLRYKLETSPMSFDAEQKMMKLVHSIEKKLAGMGDVSGLNSNIKELSKEIDALKKEADEVHHTIQTNAKESQKKHEEMIAFSKRIDELKVKEEEAFATFKKHKEEFMALNEKLKEKLRELAEINKKLDAHHIETGHKKKKSNEKANAVKLEEKKVSVEEKIQKRQKLTTEDLLVFQKGE